MLILVLSVYFLAFFLLQFALFQSEFFSVFVSSTCKLFVRNI